MLATSQLLSGGLYPRAAGFASCLLLVVLPLQSWGKCTSHLAFMQRRQVQTLKPAVPFVPLSPPLAERRSTACTPRLAKELLKRSCAQLQQQLVHMYVATPVQLTATLPARRAHVAEPVCVQDHPQYDTRAQSNKAREHAGSA
jgi:hypothetical protein